MSPSTAEFGSRFHVQAQRSFEASFEPFLIRYLQWRHFQCGFSHPSFERPRPVTPTLLPLHAPFSFLIFSHTLKKRRNEMTPLDIFVTPRRWSHVERSFLVIVLSIDICLILDENLQVNFLNISRCTGIGRTLTKIITEPFSVSICNAKFSWIMRQCT